MTQRFAHSIALAAAGFLFIAAQGGDARAATANNVKCNGCVGAKDIGKKAISKKAIQKEAVAAKAIRKGAVKANRLHDKAKPAGIAYAEMDDTGVGIGGNETTMLTVELKAPAAGYVRVTAYGTLEYAAQELVFCSLNTVEAYYDPAAYYATGNSDVENRYKPVAMERLFEVQEGTGTYYYVCRTDGGNAVQIVNPRLIAEYVPQQY